jgi:hypothetical protein
MTDQPTSPPRRLEYLTLTDLVERQTEGNPKDHKLVDIGESFDRWGFTEPGLVDERTGLIVAGHGRLAAAIEAKAAYEDAMAQYESDFEDYRQAVEELDDDDGPGAPAPPEPVRPEVPEGIVVTNDGEWALPIVRGWASANDQEARDYVVATNRLVEAGGWKLDLLAEFMEGGDLTGTGWDPAELDDLYAGLDAPIDLPESGTDAEHNDLPPPRKGEPPPPRQEQGLRERVLVFSQEQAARFDSAVAQLKTRYDETRVPLVVLEAVEAEVAAAKGEAVAP